MSASIIQLAPPIWVKTPLGDGVALMVIDYGVHTNSCWVCALAEQDWAVKHFDSNDVRVQKNWTYHFGTTNKNKGEQWEESLDPHTAIT